MMETLDSLFMVLRHYTFFIVVGFMVISGTLALSSVGYVAGNRRLRDSIHFRDYAKFYSIMSLYVGGILLTMFFLIGAVSYAEGDYLFSEKVISKGAWGNEG